MDVRLFKGAGAYWCVNLVISLGEGSINRTATRSLILLLSLCPEHVQELFQGRSSAHDGLLAARALPGNKDLH